MLLIGFTQAAPANTLAAYLNNKGISCRLVQAQSSEGQQQFQLYLIREADHPEASLVVERFLQNPNQPDFLEAAWQQGAPARLTYANGISLGRIKRNLQSVPFTSAILVMALLIHFLVFAVGQFQLFDILSFQPWPLVMSNGEIWRLITPTLMHFSLLHLAFNLMWWFWLGRDIEGKLGAGMIIGVYFTTGLISNYSQFLVSGDNFGGLSGVVYGLLGFCWWLSLLRPQLQISVPKPIVGFMLLWLVIGYLDVLWLNMANTAHLTGLVSGCLLAVFYLVLGKLQKR